MVLIPQARLFPPFQRAAPPPGIKSPPPPFPKAVEWLDSSKPCWLSRSLFRAIVWPRRRSRPSRGAAPLRVYFGSSDWSACVCVYVVSLGYRQPGRRGSILWTYDFVYPAISTTLGFSAGFAIYGGVCVNIPEQACGSWPDGWNGTFLTLYVHRSVFQAAQRTRGVDLHRFGPRVLRRKERN